MGKKNLVFFLSDQFRYDMYCNPAGYGPDTPNLNALAAESARFTNTYTAQPVCTPARGTILTGLYPHNNGSMMNNIPLKQEVKAFPELIKDEGYKSCYIGKWHLGNETIRQHGFDEWISTEEYKGYVTDSEYAKVNSSYYHFLKKQGFCEDKELKDGLKIFSREFCTRLPERYSKAAFASSEARHFIMGNKDKPFVLYVNFLEPHPPYNSCLDDLYPLDQVKLPTRFDMVPDKNTPLKYAYNRLYCEQTGRQFPLKGEKEWRKLISRYWGAVTLVDRHIGLVMEALKEAGIGEETIVCFTSDHGDMMGDFRMIQKSNMFEPASRVPLLVKIPGLTNQAVEVRENVSQIDLVPTLIDAMNLKIPCGLDGKSLLPAISGDKSLENNDVFIEWNGSEGEDLYFKSENKEAGEATAEEIKRQYGANARAVVTPDKWKLVLHDHGVNELYDLNSDTSETINRYSDPSCIGKRREMTDKIKLWCRQYNDFFSFEK